MKYGILLIPLLALSCQLDTRLNRLDKGRRQADAFLDALGNDSLATAALQGAESAVITRTFSQALAGRCDWPSRRGKFIDFYMHSEEEERFVTYIYEYFLDCDSIRLLLTFDTSTDDVPVHSAHIEPIENKNAWLVDPMKSILKDKEWEKKK
jgi:hypothetical protein